MSFIKGRVAVVTDTFYPHFDEEGADHDTLRGTLCIKSVCEAVSLGLTVIVVDGGSNASFRALLGSSGAAVLDQELRGMSNGRRQGFREAFSRRGIDVILRMEGEKHPLLFDSWLEMAAEQIFSGEADIIVPSRCEEGFLSLPPFQMESEQDGNRTFNAALRQHGLLNRETHLDAFFGPRIFGRKALPYFLKTSQYKGVREQAGFAIQPESYSEALFFPLCTGLKDGLRVLDLPAPHYRHPEEQTLFETGKPEFDRKRVQQRLGILAEQELLLRMLRGEKPGLTLHAAI